MSKSTTRTQGELLSTQLGINESHNSNSSNEELLEKIPVENSPFVIVGQKNKGYNLMLGRQGMIEQILPTVDDVIKWMNENTWELAFRMVITIIEYQKLPTENEN